MDDRVQILTWGEMNFIYELDLDRKNLNPNLGGLDRDWVKVWGLGYPLNLSTISLFMEYIFTYISRRILNVNLFNLT